jgi:hypothetical protein
MSSSAEDPVRVVGVQQTAVIGLCERSAQLGSGQHPSEITQRTSDARDWEIATVGRVQEPSAVDANAG